MTQLTESQLQQVSSELAVFSSKIIGCGSNGAIDFFASSNPTPAEQAGAIAIMQKYITAPEIAFIRIDTHSEYIAPIPVIPQVVSMRQARIALLNAGLLTTVNNAILTMAESAKIEWEYATEVNRQSSLVLTMATALNLSTKQLDDLFLAASLIL